MSAQSAADYIRNAPHRDGVERLRAILLAAGLEETLKWGQPCYRAANRNVVGLGAFKSYFGLWFFDGAAIDDDLGVLVSAQPGKTKSLRQWRMQSAAAIDPEAVARYVARAVAVAEAGGAPRGATGVAAQALPEELEAALSANPGLCARFEALTPGRRRGYAAYIADAKHAATRARRLEKIMPMIAAGRGLNDRYR